VNLLRATSWSFAFEGQRWFDGFRSLATHGIDKPVLNVMRMFGLMDHQRVKVLNPRRKPVDSILAEGVHPAPDIRAIATADQRSATVMLWNYEDDDLPAAASRIRLTVEHIPAQKILLSHYRIDSAHSNAYAVWRQMGSPQQVTPGQYRKLEQAGGLQLIGSPAWIHTPGGKATFTFSLPRQGISLLKIQY
jgi:xylan 1,4-beta-xylosidase